MNKQDERKKKVLHDQEVELDYHARKAYKKVEGFKEPEPFTLTQWIRGSKIDPQTKIREEEERDRLIMEEVRRSEAEDLDDTLTIQRSASLDDEIIDLTDRVEAEYSKSVEVSHNKNTNESQGDTYREEPTSTDQESHPQKKARHDADPVQESICSEHAAWTLHLVYIVY